MGFFNFRNALVSISLLVGTIRAQTVNTAPYDPSQFANIGTITRFGHCSNRLRAS